MPTVLPPRPQVHASSDGSPLLSMIAALLALLLVLVEAQTWARWTGARSFCRTARSASRSKGLPS
jgi:hypothetical protein